MKVCKIENCNIKHSGKGYCNKHYQRFYRLNNPDKYKPKTNIHLTPYERFMQHTEVTDGCWLWTGNIGTHGYGTLSIHSKHNYAHRLAYKLFIGIPNDNLVLDHLCEVRSCVNPFHLEEVSNYENIRRSHANRYGTTHCTRGHLWSDDNTRYYVNQSTGYKQKRCKKCNVIDACAWRNKKRLLTYATAYANIEVD